MSLLVDIPSAAQEQIQRAAVFVLFKTLNDALDSVQDAWNESDQDYATTLGRDYIPTVLEHVANENFHEGHRPSLISAPIERYPNVSVMSYRSTPGPGTESWDHQEKYRVTLAVEVMVKATEEEGEEVCNRRIQRMVEATNACLMAHTTLGGIVSGFDGTPSLSVTELFTRKDRGGDAGDPGTRASYGSTWLWQGGRLEYAVRKEASMPSHTGSNFRSVPTYTGLDIDQID